MKPDTTVVVGLGEVGKPLLDLLSRHHRTVGIDIAPCADAPHEADVLHICFPFQISDFAGETLRYMDRFHPKLTIIDSTVAVGTTRRIAELSGAAVVSSPVRGKHAHMLEDMSRYAKFIGAIDPGDGLRAAKHFEAAGLTAKLLSSPEATELAKLTETTYFGVLIAWAQEVERYCDRAGASYDEVVSIFDEIGFFPPVKYFPGIIGGHCVMPNIEILDSFVPSTLLEAIRRSNRMKIEREERVAAGRAVPELQAAGK